MLEDCVGSFVDAGSSDSLKRVAAHLRSSGVWCGGDSIVHSLVDPDHLPRSGRDPIRDIHCIAGVSAACGWALGKPLLDPARVCGARSAAIRGAGIGTLALLLFAPLFSTLYVLTQPATEHWSILGLAFLVLVGGFLAVWWLVALTGAVVGWGLNRLASRDVATGA